MSQENLDIIQSDAGLVSHVRAMIEQTKEVVARTINAGVTLLYWRIGRRVQTEALGNERAEYGKEIVQSLIAQLSWTHFQRIIPLKDELARDFAPKCATSNPGALERLPGKSKENKSVVARSLQHYRLEANLNVGYRVRGPPIRRQHRHAARPPRDPPPLFLGLPPTLERIHFDSCGCSFKLWQSAKEHPKRAFLPI